MPDYLKSRRGCPPNPHRARALRILQRVADEREGNGQPVFEYTPLPALAWQEMVELGWRDTIRRWQSTANTGRRRQRLYRMRKVYKAMGMFARMEHGERE